MSNPNPNQENLRKFTDMTPEEHRELSKKGAIASTESKRARKSMREMLDLLLQEDIQLKDGGKMNAQLAILKSAITNAVKGKIQALQFIRDTIGEKPVDVVQFKPTDKSIEEIDSLVNDGK